MEIETYEKDGRIFMRSVGIQANTQTAEELVDELNLLGELDLPLFS